MSDFEWKAIYKDGTNLEQFDKDRQEHLFKEIKLSELESLVVTKDEFKYKINVIKGTIVANGTKIVKDCTGDIVCFRRTMVYLGPDVKILEKCRVFHLGIGNKKITIKKDGSYDCVGFDPIQEKDIE